MEEKNDQNKKELTLNDLAHMMDDRFDKLATSVQKEFLELKDEIKSDTEDIKADLSKKVDRITHNELVYCVEKLEKKFA